MPDDFSSLAPVANTPPRPSEPVLISAEEWQALLWPADGPMPVAEDLLRTAIPVALMQREGRLS